MNVETTAERHAPIAWKKLAAARDWATLNEIRVRDVVLPTRHGVEIGKRCISKPTDHQEILLDRLGLRQPSTIKQIEI